VTFADVRPRHADFHAQCAQVIDLLLAHLVGNDQQQPIALLRGGQCESEPGVAGGRFDDRRARRKLALQLGGFDHSQANPVLDRTSGIVRFQLRKELAAAGVELGEPHDRRVADQVEDVPIGAHRGAVGLSGDLPVAAGA
jgi:hypothetical protein